MCIGIPMQVLRCYGLSAICDDRGTERHIDLSLVGPQQPGTWVMTFLGAAREVIDGSEACRSLNAIAAIEMIMQGGHVDIDALFADLVDREPERPSHLAEKADTTSAESS